MTDQLWVSAEIKRGSVVLVSPTVLPAIVEDTFGSLLDKVGNGSADHSLELQVETVEYLEPPLPLQSMWYLLNAPIMMVSLLYCQ